MAGVRDGLDRVARAASERDFPRLAGLLDHGSGTVSRAAARALRRLLPDAAPALLEKLRSATPGSILAERCLQVEDAAVASMLLDELELERDARVRAALLGALSFACDAGSFSRLLDHAVAGGDYFSASAASVAIHRLGGSFPVAALSRALTEPPQETVRRAAASCLALRGPEGSAALKEALSSRRVGVSAIAREALTGMDRAARAAAAEAMPTTEAGALRLLASAAALIEAGSPDEAVPLLGRVLEAGDHVPSLSALRLLAGGGASAVPLLTLVVKADVHLRAAASIALMENGSAESLSALGFLLADEYAPVRWASACALGLAGHVTALDVLLEALSEGDERWKINAARALSWVRADKARQALCAAEDGRTPPGRAAAVSLALAWPGRGGKPAVDIAMIGARPRYLGGPQDTKPMAAALLEMLASNDAGERFFAVRELGAIGDSSAADALATTSLDSDERVALQARMALYRLPV